jgi:hypothetical protein
MPKKGLIIALLFVVLTGCSSQYEPKHVPAVVEPSAVVEAPPPAVSPAPTPAAWPAHASRIARMNTQKLT